MDFAFAAAYCWNVKMSVIQTAIVNVHKTAVLGGALLPCDTIGLSG